MAMGLLVGSVNLDKLYADTPQDQCSACGPRHQNDDSFVPDTPKCTAPACNYTRKSSPYGCWWCSTGNWRYGMLHLFDALRWHIRWMVG